MERKLVTYKIDEVTFELQEEVDLSWLRKLGHVFAVFDQQDSGNICFGVEKEGQKKFVKFAGARTIEYEGDPQDAVARLTSAIPNYYELKHPCLIEITDHFKVNSGYVAIFKWFDGANLHPHWSFPLPAKYLDPNSPFYKYRHLPLEERLNSLDRIYDFHAFVEEKNYVAIDFYDGSILYSFPDNETRICDIDFYQRKPYQNTMGRLWGSSRFMSPEEFELDAEINSRTNVYTMGALAFVVLGGELDRSLDKWEASHELYNIANRAINEDKQKRYQSVKEFYTNWKESAKSKGF